MLDLTKKPYNLTPEQIQQLQDKVQAMSLEEKIGQLFFVIGQDEEQVDIKKFIETYRPGGMMYRPAPAEKIKRELAAAQEASDIPLFFSANLESGGNGIISEGTWFGMPLQIAATDDSTHAYELGNVAGEEAAQVGCNMSFSPIVDIDKNFRNPITNTRTFGSDQERVIQMAEAQIKGLQENQILPVIKHFPGDGVDERDQHLLSSVNSLSAEDWMASYGKIYQTFIDQGIASIMIGHIFQPAWERKLMPEIADADLKPASASKLLIDGLLRETLGFNGLTITDATPMLGYNAIMPREKLLPATINAGVDMILFNKNIDEDYAFIKQAVADGTLQMERIEEAVLRILGTKMAHGLFDLKELSAPLELNLAEHAEKAAAAAKKSVTLVKDRDQLLPLTVERYPRIRMVVLGDSDDGGFKEGGKVTEHFQAQLESLGFEVTLYDRSRLDFHEIFEEGVAEMEEKFDLALYIANIETASNQTTTRLDWIHLMAADAPWFMKSIPTVFISTANPYHLFDVPAISTYINTYTGNKESIAAVIRKMTGAEAFEGISPVDPFCGDFTTKL
ncbi:glycoside hydrolase family 3 N-terminal domain-containing protein [Enterococcus hulanensis]|uniref:glycoside hydrolase family 3 protein n=1 Tax=Enterococcus hulanensis TaxID=2559929 RepID=UPI002890475F|nr:glycoside hydrolase family 3 N-terminal domain-containing protein [Enterococcus hulanensis]MDT2661336.1 glycoside hydrolase family 3 N-terminal domain-containing protein [Enterococcus hulanensis]